MVRRRLSGPRRQDTAPSRPADPSTPPRPGEASVEPDIPATGPGTFTVAPGESATAGSGAALRHQVEAEDGLDLSACDVAKNVMVNLKRWLFATPVYPGCRALIINHDVGHFLGHVGCPGTGRPAPVMMQQIKGRHGCLPNVRPCEEHGQYVTGPAVA